MKKIILTAAAVFAFSFANAQDSKSVGLAKGDIYATGTVSSVSVSGGDSETTFAPALGYLVTDNVALFAGFSSSNGASKSSDFSIGAAYLFNAKNQFSSNVSLGLGLGSQTISAVDYKTTTLALKYGVNYFVSSHFALRADIGGLSYSSIKASGADAVNTTAINLDLRNISLGLAYKF